MWSLCRCVSSSAESPAAPDADGGRAPLQARPRPQSTRKICSAGPAHQRRRPLRDSGRPWDLPVPSRVTSIHGRHTYPVSEAEQGLERKDRPARRTGRRATQ